MSSGATDRNTVPAKDEAECKNYKGYSWLSTKNICAADCRSPEEASWDNTRNVPTCLMPQGTSIDESGARSDVNERNRDPTANAGSYSPPSDIQTRAVDAARQTDVFYRDTKSGVEIPATIPTGYLITAGIGLALGFMFFRR